tara:strand:- start:388 stop:534 length:147 start_codon:yes stop_codon:yes gene_type:complete
MKDSATLEKAKNICLVIAMLLLLMVFTVNGATQKATASGMGLFYANEK